MKNFFFCLLLIGSFSAAAQEPLNVMTFNIRYNNPGDSLNAWPFRKDMAASQVLFHQVDLLGVQEALYEQITDLRERMPGYQYFGVGRNDGKTSGEFSAIFYDTTRLLWQKGETFWLSQTPAVPGSKGWDADITRIVTWCLFKDKLTGKNFYAFNTHFDHKGQQARAESAKLLLRKVQEIAGSLPVVVTGDFNAKPSDEPIRIITAEADDLHLTDSKSISRRPHYGPGGTFNAFQQKELSDEPIDHIFIKNHVKVWQHATLSQSWKGRFSSDHFPVFARVAI